LSYNIFNILIIKEVYQVDVFVVFMVDMLYRGLLYVINIIWCNSYASG